MTGKLSIKNGVWHVVLYYKNHEGQHRQKWITTGLKERGNKKAAVNILNEKLIEYAYLENENYQPNPIAPTIEDKKENSDIRWLDWLKAYVESIKDELSPFVVKLYSKTYAVTFNEFWGETNPYLKDITTEDIIAFYDYLKTERKIKNVTIKHYSNVIRPALRRAYKEKLIKENPHDFVPTIKKEKVTHNFYDQEDMEKLFTALKGHKMEFPLRMLAYYGLRRSELLGLKWSAIDFTNKTIEINHKVLVVEKEIYRSDKMKTQTSLRTLPLIPQMEQELLNQKAYIEKNIDYFGTAYNFTYKDYVFVHENGDLILPDCLTHNFAKILKRNGLKYIRLHDLRHSCASIMLKNGVQMKQIQEWLGHSNFSTTADIYSHLDYSSKIESAQKIAGALKYDGDVEIETDRVDVRPVISEELLKKEKERQMEEDINEELKTLKSQMKALGFTKLSELFAYLENKTED